MSDTPHVSGHELILVLGMHRSGTSALTGLLSCLGVALSDVLVEAGPDNPTGFFEHAEIWQLDHELLKALGSNWDDPGPLPEDWLQYEQTGDVAERIGRILDRDFAGAGLAAIKDPRMCRLVPLWRRIAHSRGLSLKTVWIVRDPVDVAASLVRRDGLDLEQALWVWLRYNLEAETHSRGLQRAMVRYESLLYDWPAAARQIEHALGVSWPRPWKQAAPLADRLIDPSLNHYQGQTDISGLDEPLRGWVIAIRDALRDQPGDLETLFDSIRRDVARLDQQMTVCWPLARRLRLQKEEAERASQQAWHDLQWHVRERENLVEKTEDLKSAKDRLTRERASLETARDSLETELAQIQQSRSWRITRPLRVAAWQLRRAAGRLPEQTALPETETFDPSQADEAALQTEAPDAAMAYSNIEFVTEPGPSTDSADSAIIPASKADAAQRVTVETPRRILIASPDFVGPIRNGGIGTAFTALAQRLAAAGHEVTVLYTLGDYCEDGSPITSWVRHYAEQSIHFVPLRAEKNEPKLDAPWYCWHAYRVYLWLKSHADEFDLVYFPEWRGEAYYALLAKKTGVAFDRLCFIVVSHSPTVWAEGGNYCLPPWLDSLDLEFMERKVVEMADWLVSPSQYLVDWMQGRGWSLPARTRVMQNLLPFAHTPAATEAIAGTVVREWVFFGRLEIRKGLKIFIDGLLRLAPAQRKKHRITFLGKAITNDQFDSIQYIRDRLGDQEDTCRIITGYDRDQALAYLGEPGRVAVIASLVENSPYTVLECLVAGIPFISADVGGIGELVHPEDREQALFRPTPAALATALSELDARVCHAARPAQRPDATEKQWLNFQDEAVAALPADGDDAAPSPHITVCLTHYERPVMLATALDSLRQQSYKDFDVVLVDDGSTSQQARDYLDSLHSEFEQYGWQLIRQENAYLGAGRNTAARQGRGEYLLFMDDDNIAKPDELAVFARAAVRTGADVLTAVSDVFHGDAETPMNSVSRHLWIPLGSAPSLGVFRNAFGDANALVRRETFEQVGGFTEDYGIGHEDWEFFGRAVLSGARLMLVPEPLFWYRVDSQSMLLSGESAVNDARSIRPYQEKLPDGLGDALAYALQLHRNRESGRLGVDAEPMRGSARVRSAYRAGRQAFNNPILRAKFSAVRRQYGWREAVSRALRYAKQK